MYKYNIGMGDKYNFGVELEFSYAELMSVYQNLINNFLPVLYVKNHKTRYSEFDKWFLDADVSVTKIAGKLIMGGELSSRILSDDAASWDELEKICTILGNVGAEATDVCATHITVDIKRYLNKPTFFETLIKIIILYEIEMNIFFMGDKYLVRKSKNEFSRNMSIELIKLIDNIDFTKDDFLKQIQVLGRVFKLSNGISFFKLYMQGLIEFKYPNGSLNPKTVQNYVNFVLKLIDAIGNDKFDIEFLDYSLLKEKLNPIFQFRNLYYVDEFERFLNIVDVISFDDTDKESFCKQYHKVIDSKNKKVQDIEPFKI